MDTCGSNPYSELDVFTGASVDALTEVVQGDYGCTSGGRAYLDANAGTTYYVRVSGYAWGAAIALTVARPQAPANDDFADAQVVGAARHCQRHERRRDGAAGRARPAPLRQRPLRLVPLHVGRQRVPDAQPRGVRRRRRPLCRR